MARVVLVTGVSRYLGACVAGVLQSDPNLDRVIGVDAVPPANSLGRTEFVRVDLRTPSIAKIIAAADVDTVVHLNLVGAPQGAGGRSSMKDINVIGTMQLLAACQRSASVHKLVVRSTAEVYGCTAHDPAMFTEDMEPRSLPRSGFTKDASEIEGYVRGFNRRRNDVTVSILRFVNFMGRGVDSPLARYFTLPVAPTVLGFDPRLQFVHTDDGVEVVRQMTVQDHPGTYNVGGDGVMYLSQALRRAGRPTVPVLTPAMRISGGLGRRLRLADFTPEQVRLLSYGRGVDTTKVQAELGWRASHTTVEAFDDFVRGHGWGPHTELIDRAASFVRTRADGVVDATSSRTGRSGEAGHG